jgi:uncharacterized membrane protein
MKVLQFAVMAVLLYFGVRWAVREGSRPPDEVARRWFFGYDELGNPVYEDEDEIDVEKTDELNREIRSRARNA